MTALPSTPGPALEARIDQWRGYVRRHRVISAADVEELEEHLRDQVADLQAAGLSGDEAFLVAVIRMGNLDEVSREFAREHSERLWKQLVITAGPGRASGATAGRELVVVVVLAAAAAVAIKLPALAGRGLDGSGAFYALNLGLFVLPFLAAYFAWKRQLGWGRGLALLAPPFLVAALIANLSPFADPGDTEVIVAIHLPVVLWFAVGLAYVGGDWRAHPRRMDFIRFTGEWVVYYTLLALGGGVLTGFLVLMFQTIGIDAEPFIVSWLLPCGAAGAALVASWLVEAKQSVIENMAPVLTRLFTPLFTAVLVTFLGALLLTGRGVAIERDMLIAFDLLLVLVLALLLYAISARDPQAPPGAFDVLQLVLVGSALLADAVALWAIAARITEFGVSPNRAAVLGVNAILLINLAWSAVLSLRFLRGRGSFAALERWQTRYLPVYAAWAALVVIAFPPLFGNR